MAIAVIGEGVQTFEGSFRSLKAYTQSTSTAVQTLDPSFDVLTLGMGTATAGFGVNRYLLATNTAMEGRGIVVQTDATGSAYLVFTGTSTGALVFAGATDQVRLRHANATWYIVDAAIHAGATVATATGTA